MRKLLFIFFIVFFTAALGQVKQSSTKPDYKKDIASLTTIIKTHPDSINCYLKRAALVYELNSKYPKQEQSELKMKDVISDLDKAIVIQPNNASLYEQRGEYKWRINHDTTGALSDKSKAIELEPGNPRWLGKRGTLYFELHDYDKACADCSKGAEMGDEICKRGKENFCPVRK